MELGDSIGSAIIIDADEDYSLQEGNVIDALSLSSECMQIKILTRSTSWFPFLSVSLTYSFPRCLLSPWIVPFNTWLLQTYCLISAVEMMLCHTWGFQHEAFSLCSWPPPCKVITSLVVSMHPWEFISATKSRRTKIQIHTKRSPEKWRSGMRSTLLLLPRKCR